MNSKRIILVANTDRAEIADLLANFRNWLKERCHVIAEYSSISGAPLNGDGLADLDTALQDWQSLDADLALVIGGDGTILNQARRFVNTDIPILGINLGTLGFLTEYDLDSFMAVGDSMLRSPQPIVYRDRTLLEAMIFPPGAEIACADDAASRSQHRSNARFFGVALNECAIVSGAPFRMIELSLQLDSHPTPTIKGDGIIVSTPTGSTGYNVSAGGPIISPDLDCFAVTPIAVHSLALRPIIVNSKFPITIEIKRANEGTTMSLDGQNYVPLNVGDRVVICRYEKKVRMAINPQNNFWQTLIHKMHWAATPEIRPGSYAEASASSPH